MFWIPSSDIRNVLVLLSERARKIVNTLAEFEKGNRYGMILV